MGLAIVWLGLFVGVEQTGLWRSPFQQPGLSESVTALVGVGQVTVRAVYIQPLQRHVGPALQVGVSVRVF